MKELHGDRAKQIANIEMLRAGLEEKNKDILDNNQLRRLRTQCIHNGEANTMPMNIAVGDYVIVRTHANRQQKLYSRWRGPIRVKEARSK